MKLKSLLEYDKPEFSVSRRDVKDYKEIDDYVKAHGGKKLGSGVFAVVYDKSDAVQTVIKRGVTGFKDGRFGDGYLTFILELMKDSRASDNHFLPQIFSVKIDCSNYVMGSTLCKYIVEMEKLEAIEKFYDSKEFELDRVLSAINSDPQSHFSQVILMLSKLTNAKPESLIKYVVGKVKEANDIDGDNRKVGLYEIWTVIEKLIHKMIINRPPGGIKITDKRLLEAIELLKKYQDRALDLHMENVMLRRSPYGLQLVISDPFGY